MQLRTDFPMNEKLHSSQKQRAKSQEDWSISYSYPLTGTGTVEQLEETCGGLVNLWIRINSSVAILLTTKSVSCKWQIGLSVHQNNTCILLWNFVSERLMNSVFFLTVLVSFRILRHSFLVVITGYLPMATLRCIWLFKVLNWVKLQDVLGIQCTIYLQIKRCMLMICMNSFINEKFSA